MTNPVKDRSGVGLPPKAERRAAAKAAKERRRRAERRKKVLKMVATVVGVVVVIGAVAVACGAFDNKTGASPSGSASGAAASAPAVALDPKLQTKPEVSAGSGELKALNVETLVTGTGPKVTSGQTLSVNYVGVSYQTGEEFDTSWGKGQPFSFKVGTGAVIPGWDQGLVGVPVGSRVQLDIPTELAYAGAEGSPPGPLRFVVDVLSAT